MLCRRRSWPRRALWALALALAMALVLTTACLGDGSYVEIGRQGGRVAAAGATLSIAPDILSSPIQFKISRTDPAQLPALGEPSGRTAQSDPFHFQSRGGEGMPATVSIPLKTPLPAETPLEVYQLYQGEWVWLTTASAHPDGNAVALIPSLPAIVMVVSLPPTSPQVSLRWSLPVSPAEEALRLATSVHPPGYQVTPDGSLIAQPGWRAPSRYRVIPVVQSGGPGAFDGALIAAILNNEEPRQRHLERLVALVEDGEYAGLELDYRGLDLSLRPILTAFVADLSKALHQRDRLLYLDVPLPQRGDGGWNDGAYDWRQLGELVDALVVCPPKDLSFYSARMDEVLRYGISQVERRKLRLGINTSSHEKGPEGVQDISRSQALERAARIKIEGTPRLISGEVVTLLAPLLALEKDGSSGGQTRLSFSQEANALAFTYTASGERRLVWIENAQSLAYKLELAQRYRLGGVNLEGDFGGTFDARLWQVLSSYRDRGQVEPLREGEMPVPSWQSSDGSLKEKGPARVNWRLPPPGGYVVTLCLGDGAAQGCQELSLTVALPPPTPTPSPRATATPTPTPAPMPAPPQASRPSISPPSASVWGNLDEAHP